MLRLPLHITDALDVAIGGEIAVQLTPRQGLQLAEDLTRKAMRRVMAEEAARHGVALDPPLRPRIGRAAR